VTDWPWLEIVIPARNEEARLPGGLAELCRKVTEIGPRAAIIVVDNASTDATPEIVRSWPAGPVLVRLVSCPSAGKGAAVRAGILSTRAPYVGFCDADMASDLCALDVALELLQNGKLLVIGSRSHPDSVVEDRSSIVRKAGAAVFRGFARAVVPKVGDTQCGFKFMAGPLARTAASQLRSTGFSFDIEFLALCRRLGAEPTEIPVTWRDVPGSTFSIWRHSASAFAEVAAIWVRLRLLPGRAQGDSAPQPAQRHEVRETAGQGPRSPDDATKTAA
jgi:dolichyl-phosphate beta-glucosyltransferase